MNNFIYNQITNILEENNIHISDFLNYAIQKEKGIQLSKTFNELERCLIANNTYAKAQPKDKEQEAYFQGLKTALEIITGYNYTFNRQNNKIAKIEWDF